MTTEMYGDSVPFRLHRRLSLWTVIYAVLLTLLAALIAGCLPGLKVTRGLALRLKEASAGGGGLKFGGMWTAMIVTQVGFMAMVPVFLFVSECEAHQIRSMDVGFAAEEYLSASIGIDETMVQRLSRDSLRARVAAASLELERRLEAVTGVAAVTFAERLPLMYHPHRRIDVDEGGAAQMSEELGYRRVSATRVALDFFDAVRAPTSPGARSTPEISGPTRIRSS